MGTHLNGMCMGMGMGMDMDMDSQVRVGLASSMFSCRRFMTLRWKAERVDELWKAIYILPLIFLYIFPLLFYLLLLLMCFHCFLHFYLRMHELWIFPYGMRSGMHTKEPTNRQPPTPKSK